MSLKNPHGTIDRIVAEQDRPRAPSGLTPGGGLITQLPAVKLLPSCASQTRTSRKIDRPAARLLESGLNLPCPVLALRTMKSEIAVGIASENIPTADPTWMSNGRWGLVQFMPLQKEAKSRV